MIVGTAINYRFPLPKESDLLPNRNKNDLSVDEARGHKHDIILERKRAQAGHHLRERAALCLPDLGLSSGISA